MKKSPNFKRFKAGARKTVQVSQESLVKTSFLNSEKLPMVIEPAAGKIGLKSWLEGNRELVQKHLLDHCAILFRGFDLSSPEQFYDTVKGYAGELLDYKERAAPRNEVSKGVYTSTEFPADQVIPMHHEMSYSHNWPENIWFYCDQPPAERGCTPLTPDREVVKQLDPEIKERFLKDKVMYVRNYGEGVDLSWQEAFQTDDREVVEGYCRQAGAQVEWRNGDRLRTRTIRQVTATHPRTGETLWFNHAHMFHVSNMPSAVRDALLSEFADDELPRNAFYGDGTPIETPVLDEIRGLYDRLAIKFDWQKGDALLVDNFLASHGREPFVGPRRILVAMTHLYTSPEIAPV